MLNCGKILIFFFNMLILSEMLVFWGFFFIKMFLRKNVCLIFWGWNWIGLDKICLVYKLNFFVNKR